MASRRQERDNLGGEPSFNLVTPQMPEADRRALDRLAGQYAKPIAFQTPMPPGRHPRGDKVLPPEGGPPGTSGGCPA